jgi:hypothetical protein
MFSTTNYKKSGATMIFRKIALVGILGVLAACNVSDDDPVVSSNNTTANNNTNNGAQDCAGNFGGAATEDMCGTCDTDPANDCVKDCAGVYGGDSAEDNCGVCDADPANDCDADCAGTPQGTATEDMCGTCDTDPTNDCVQDCTGEFGGEAVNDLCGRCVEGATGLVACPTATLTVVEDAYVDSTQPTANFGADVSVVADRNTTETYLKFDLSSLPNDAVIRGLTLKAVAYESTDFGGNGDVNVYFSSDDRWTESTITYDTKPAFSDESLASWNVKGLMPATDLLLEIVDDQGLLEHVQSQVLGDKTITFVLASPRFSSKYHSKESPNATDHMTLEVAYQVLSKVDLPAVADAFVMRASGDGNFGSDLVLQVNPQSAGNLNPPITSFIKFDLTAIPANVEIQRSALRMRASQGFAYGGDGNTYTYLLDDDTWGESTLTFNNQPSYQSTPIGYWWIWYDRAPIGIWGVNVSEALNDATKEAYTTDKLISFRLASSGFRTEYRARDWPDASQQPKLTVYFIEN